MALCTIHGELLNGLQEERLQKLWELEGGAEEEVTRPQEFDDASGCGLWLSWRMASAMGDISDIVPGVFFHLLIAHVVLNVHYDDGLSFSTSQHKASTNKS